MSPTDVTRPAETPSARTYEQRPVASSAPGHRSPAPTEPGDKAAERAEETPSSRDEPGSAGRQGSRGG